MPAPGWPEPKPWVAGVSTLQKFWDPVFASSGPVLICVGLQDGFGRGLAQNQSGQAQSSQNQQASEGGGSALPDPLAHRVAMADLLTLARVANYAGERHAQYRILDPLSTSFSDLQNEPTVLIGVGNNNWTKRISNQLRFSFVTERTQSPGGRPRLA